MIEVAGKGICQKALSRPIAKTTEQIIIHVEPTTMCIGYMGRRIKQALYRPLQVNSLFPISLT